MYKCFRFLGCLGLASVCTALYGAPYPSLNDVYSHLCSKVETDEVITGAFKSAYELKNLSLIGETNGSLTLPNGFAPKYYTPKDYRDWQWKFGTIYGFFSCTVNGASVFNEETLRKAVEASETDRLGKTMLTRADTQRITEIVKICRVLLSEEFAKKLLTEPLLQALYDNKDAAYTCFDVKFSPDALDKNIFRFEVMYSQTVKEEKRQSKDASVFALRFSFGYDLQKHDFGGVRVDNGGKCWGAHQPHLEYLGINGEEVRSSFSNFDERGMARVWRHPFMERMMCKGEEKVSGKENDVFEEEEHENSEKSKEGLGLEEDEEDLNDVFEGEEHENSGKSGKGLGLEEEEDEEDLKVYTGENKEDEASKLCDPNKRPRSFDSSEDEKSEGNFKKKE